MAQPLSGRSMIALQLFAGCLQQLAPYMFLCLYPFRKRLRYSRPKIFLSAASHGIGLKSIADISEKYHGGVEFTHEGAEFHASVMLGLE